MFEADRNDCNAPFQIGASKQASKQASKTITPDGAQTIARARVLPLTQQICAKKKKRNHGRFQCIRGVPELRVLFLADCQIARQKAILLTKSAKLYTRFKAPGCTEPRRYPNKYPNG